MSKRCYRLRVSITIRSPCAFLKHIGDITEASRAMVMRARERQQDFSMSEDSFEVLSACRAKAVQLLAHSLKIRAPVPFVVP